MGLLFAVVLNLAGYGLAWIAIMQWGYRANLWSLGERLVGRVLPDQWERGNIVQRAMYYVVGLALMSLLAPPFLLIAVCGGIGFAIGVEHAKPARLRLTGELYLGHKEDQIKTFNQFVLPLIKEKAPVDKLVSGEALQVWLDWKTPHDFYDEHEDDGNLFEDPPEFYNYAANYILDQLEDDD